MMQTLAALPVQLVDPALRALILAAVAGIALAIFRVKTTSLRLLTWRGILYGALALPILGWMLPPLLVPVPSFLQRQANGLPVRAEEQVPTHAATSVIFRTRKSVLYRESLETKTPTAALRTAAAPPTESSGTRSGFPESLSISWSDLVATIYFGIALLLVARIAIGMILSRRLLRKSATILDRAVASRLAFIARASDMAFVPEAVESRLVSVPVTIGILRSKVVLPVDWKHWGEAKLNAILAHELSHVARRDTLTQFLSLLHRAIFWFSPLAWWLDSQLAYLAEQASDEAALSRGANRNDYARVLLGFFEVLRTKPGRVWWQGVSMAKVGQAEKRLERILAWKGKVTMSLKKSVVIALFALAIPAVYLTAAVRPAGPQEAQAAPSAAQPAPTPAPVASEIPAPSPPPDEPTVPVTTSVAARGSKIAVAPFAALAPVPPIHQPGPPLAIAPVAAVRPLAAPAVWPIQSHSSGSGHSSGKGYSYAFGNDDDEQRFVIVTGNSDSMTMSGTGEDARHVERLKKQIPGDFIWFSRDEKSYIIRDQATIARARAFWAPQEELGKQQELLGKQQEELGRQQEALGQKQEEVRVKVPDMTAELDRLKAKLQKLGSTATLEQLGDLQSEIGDLQSKIGEIQSEAGEQQGKFGDEQGALGEKQGKLGEEQGKLGERQGELAEKATKQMKQLLDEAIKDGKAQPEPQSGGGSGTL